MRQKIAVKNAYTQIAWLAFGIVGILFCFQNCSDVSFTSKVETVLICDPLANGGANSDCDNVTNGFIGKIYYFLNKSSSNDIPQNVYDIMDNVIPFPNGISSVRMFFERAFKVEATLILSKIYVPVIRFSQGFKDSKNNYIKDKSGNILFEAFAFQVQSRFKLTNAMEEGDYEFAILSDDGSMVSIDENRDGQFEVLIDNDGLHSARLQCSSRVVSLRRNQELPLRVEYYQGPRTEIAVTLLVRKVPNGSARVLDADCGYTSRTEWFNGEPNDANYVPDPVNGRFGALLRRGWFIPPTDALNL